MAVRTPSAASIWEDAGIPDCVPECPSPSRWDWAWSALAGTTAALGAFAWRSMEASAASPGAATRGDRAVTDAIIAATIAGAAAGGTTWLGLRLLPEVGDKAMLAAEGDILRTIRAPIRHEWTRLPLAEDGESWLVHSITNRMTRASAPVLPDTTRSRSSTSTAAAAPTTDLEDADVRSARGPRSESSVDSLAHEDDALGAHYDADVDGRRGHRACRHHRAGPVTDDCATSARAGETSTQQCEVGAPQNDDPVDDDDVASSDESEGNNDNDDDEEDDYDDEPLDDDGPPVVVMLHGHSGGCAHWECIFDQVLESCEAIHVIDLPGWGRSPAPQVLQEARDPETVVDLHVAMLRRWLEARGLRDGRRLVLFGHSLGGLLAAHYAARHPADLRQLILSDCAGILPAMTREIGWTVAMRFFAPQQFARITGRVGYALFHPLYSMFSREDARYPAYYYTLAQCTSARGCGDLIWARAVEHSPFFRRVWWSRPILGLLLALPMPVSLIWGEHDEMFPSTHARLFHRLRPDADVYIVKDALHNPAHNNAAAVAAAICDALAAYEGAPRPLLGSTSLATPVAESLLAPASQPLSRFAPQRAQSHHLPTIVTGAPSSQSPIRAPTRRTARTDAMRILAAAGAEGVDSSDVILAMEEGAAYHLHHRDESSADSSTASLGRSSPAGVGLGALGASTASALEPSTADARSGEGTESPPTADSGSEVSNSSAAVQAPIRRPTDEPSLGERLSAGGFVSHGVAGILRELVEAGAATWARSDAAAWLNASPLRGAAGPPASPLHSDPSGSVDERSSTCSSRDSFGPRGRAPTADAEVSTTTSGAGSTSVRLSVGKVPVVGPSALAALEVASWRRRPQGGPSPARASAGSRVHTPLLRTRSRRALEAAASLEAEGRGVCRDCGTRVRLARAHWVCKCGSWTFASHADAAAQASEQELLNRFLEDLYCRGSFGAMSASYLTGRRHATARPSSGTAASTRSPPLSAAQPPTASLPPVGDVFERFPVHLRGVLLELGDSATAPE